MVCLHTAGDDLRLLDILLSGHSLYSLRLLGGQDTASRRLDLSSPLVTTTTLSRQQPQRQQRSAADSGSTTRLCRCRPLSFRLAAGTHGRESVVTICAQERHPCPGRLRLLHHGLPPHRSRARWLRRAQPRPPSGHYIDRIYACAGFFLHRKLLAAIGIDWKAHHRPRHWSSSSTFAATPRNGSPHLRAAGHAPIPASRQTPHAHSFA